MKYLQVAGTGHCHQAGCLCNLQCPKPKITSRNYNKQLLLLESCEQGESCTNTAASWLGLLFPKVSEMTKSLFHKQMSSSQVGPPALGVPETQREPESKQLLLGNPNLLLLRWGQVLERLETLENLVWQQASGRIKENWTRRFSGLDKILSSATANTEHSGGKET